MGCQMVATLTVNVCGVSGLETKGMKNYASAVELVEWAHPGSILEVPDDLWYFVSGRYFL